MTGAWICFEDEAGQSLRPPKARTWARRGHTPVVRVSGKGSGRVSVAGLVCLRPGARSCLLYRMRLHHGRKGERRSMSEADYAAWATSPPVTWTSSPPSSGAGSRPSSTGPPSSTASSPRPDSPWNPNRPRQQTLTFNLCNNGTAGGARPTPPAFYDGDQLVPFQCMISVRGWPAGVE